MELEKEYPNKVNTILQLRHHQAIVELKNKIEKGPKDKIYDIDLKYITSRGNWYYSSWKGDIDKSGGIASNIGIHFFDMLQWIFGTMKSYSIEIKTRDTNSGTLILERAMVKWFLSINSDNLPKTSIQNESSTYRNLSIEGDSIEFSKGFSDLHSVSYQKIIEGKGYGLEDAKNSVNMVSKIREN
jgi:UDP-N-acetyl-2-amino-2-deoxyglucuronate dehydrogenase